MTHALTVARRELRERNFVFGMAAIMAVLPFLAALMPMGRRFGRAMMLSGSAGIVTICFIVPFSVILGASIVGRELTERRMSFYFARPISASSVWFGKFIAAVVMIGVCFAITFLPAFAFSYREWNASVNVSPSTLTAMVLGAALMLFLISHFASVIVRSRSPLLAFDLILVVISVGATLLILRPLFANLAIGLGRAVLIFLGSGLFLSLLFAGRWQLSRGRTDIRRNHRELSKFTWIAVSGFLGVAALYVAWVLAAKPSDLTKAYAEMAPGGEWIVIGGDAWMRGDYHPTFLMNGRSGEWMRFPSSGWDGAEFTRTGSAAMTMALTEPGKWTALELRIQTLQGDRAAIDVGILTSPGSLAVLSDDLERVALLNDQTLSVHDIRTKALLGSVRIPLPRGSFPRLFFVDRNTVRLYMQSDRPRSETDEVVDNHLRIYEFDLTQRRLQQTGELTTIARWLRLQASADGSTLLIRRHGAKDDPKVLLIDGRTGTILRPFPSTDPRAVTFFGEGRVATVDMDDSKGVLRLFNRDATLQRSIDLGPANWVTVMDFARDDKLALLLRRGSRWTLSVVDTERGVIERQERDCTFRAAYNWADPRKPEPNRTGEMVITQKGTLWRWNAFTGQKTKLLGG